MTPAASNEAGSVAMLGEGNLFSAAIREPARNSTDKVARKGTSMERRDGWKSAEIFRPFGAVKK
jgi:hypothetical protein